jgi:hypothetical protein
MNGFYGGRQGLFGGDVLLSVQPNWHSGPSSKNKFCSGRLLPICHGVYDTNDHGLWECGLHYTLRNELQEKLWAPGIDHGSSIRDGNAQYGCVKVNFGILK